VIHLEPAEFHSDPLDPRGIIAFWDLGDDLVDVFGRQDLEIRRWSGPEGKDGRGVWIAEKRR
jgi:hypothetical protein